MADGKPGAPRKSEKKKCKSTNYSIPKDVDEQFRHDAILRGDDHNKLLTQFEREYHNRCQDIEIQKLIIEQEKVKLCEDEQKIKNHEKWIKELEKTDAASKKRGYNDYYINALQRVVDRFIAYPKEQKYIDERAKVLSDKYGYLLKYVLQDIREAIKQANGYKNYSDTKIVTEVV